MAYNQDHGPHQVSFWDFVRSLDANHPGNTGCGVDHTEPHPGNGFEAHFGPGFPFGPAGFHAWHGGSPHRHWRGGFRGAGFRGARFGDDGDGCGGRRSRHFGGRGGCGRHGRRHGGPAPNPEDPPTGDERELNENDAAAAAAQNEKGDSPDTMRDDTPNAPGDDNRGPLPSRPHPRHDHHHHHHHDGRHSRFGPPPPPPYAPGPGGFDFPNFMHAFASHPFAQRLQEYIVNAASRGGFAPGNPAAAAGDGTNDADADDFVPPVDIFSAETHWTVHVALPGAKKDDVGVNWDADKSQLAVSGVVHRPGDEEFLAGMVASERKVGVFERNVRLPPDGSNEKDEADPEGIRAKMEDGVLIVVVPKIEKDWTEVKKVDIE